VPTDDTLDDTLHPQESGAGLAYGPHLVVLLECDRPLAGSARYSLDGIERILIGRGDHRCASRDRSANAATLDVRVPGRWMSSSHARVLRVGSSWVLEDAGSRNGVHVEGRRVDRVVLEPGQCFELGHTFFRLDPLLATPADDPLDLEALGGNDGSPATFDGALALQLRALDALARSDVSLLLLGESGTGKEVLARRLHQRSMRSGDFVAVNCGAIPAPLVESQLFGHIKGSFSGAVRDERGLVRSADGGTLFLDEIADLPMPSQAALLRVLQEREVVPVGATRPVRVRVRVIAATHEPLDELAAQGAFRADLFARVAGFVSKLPALRERRNDVGIFISSLLRRAAGARAESIALTREVGRCLLDYDWPHNVRELEQCLGASVALARDGRIERSHLPSNVCRDAGKQGSVTPPADAWTDRDRQLRLELLGELARHQGNVSNVARAMGKERTQIHRWCRRFGILPATYRR
jgi:transcriptional regulator with AAA-type ATPase domain